MVLIKMRKLYNVLFYILLRIVENTVITPTGYKSYY